MAATLFSTSLSPQFLSLSAKPAAASFPPGLPQLRALSVSVSSWRALVPVRAAVASELDAEDVEAEGQDGGEKFSEELRLFVGNLPFSVDSAQLAGFFEQAGSVEMVEVCMCIRRL
jgi:nucleolin